MRFRNPRPRERGDFPELRLKSHDCRGDGSNAGQDFDEMRRE
jgi:hypothetical protein